MNFPSFSGRVSVMGRNVIIGDEDAVWYVPDVMNGDIPNRKDENPFAVRIIPLSGGEFNKVRSKVGLISFGKRNKINMDESAINLAKKIIEDKVLEVVGYVARNKKTGEVEQPTDGKELYKVVHMADESETDVLDDILSAIRDRSVLEKGLKESLNGSSNS